MTNENLAALALVAAALTGCASTLSTMDTARTMNPGQWRVNLATGVYVPAGAVIRLAANGVDLGRTLISENRDPTTAELDKLFEAGLALAVLPIAPVQELQIRTGIVDNLDAGFRLATTGARLDVKYRFFQSADSRHHLSIGLGGSKYFFSGPVFDALAFVKVEDFSRYDVEVPLLYTYEAGDIFRFYGGAKFIRSWFSMSSKLVRAQSVAESNGSPTFFRSEEQMTFAGATFGIMLGYKHVFVSAELTSGLVIAEPAIYSFVTKQPEKRNLGGATFFPALGLVFVM